MLAGQLGAGRMPESLSGSVHRPVAADVTCGSPFPWRRRAPARSRPNPVGTRRSTTRLAERPSCQRRWGRGDCASIGRIERRRQLVEQIVVVAQEVGRPHEQWGDVALGDCVHQRHQLVTDPVASESVVGVRRVGRDTKLQNVAEPMGLGSAEPEDRLAVARPHSGQAGCSAAPEQSEQRCFGLIVGGVSRQRVGSEHPAAGGSGPGLQVRSVGEFDALAAERRAEPTGDHSGPLGIVDGRRAQTVIDVNGVHTATRRHGEGDHRCRIRAAGQRADDVGSRRWKRAASEQVGQEFTGEISGRCRLCGHRHGAHRGREAGQRSVWRRRLPPGYFCAEMLLR